jgi:imidazolonepropionase-like amidohydrolase
VPRVATLGAARVMRVADRIGAVEPGMRADRILVDGRPHAGFEDLRR